MDFLKKLTAPGFTVTKYAQGIVHFKCSKTLKPGTEVEGVATLPDKSRFDLVIEVVSSHGGEYTANVKGPEEAIARLTKAYLPTEYGAKEQMFFKPNEEAMTRHARTYSVRSRHFHNFKGATAELSRAGALVMLTGPIESGREVDLQIDLDDTDMKPLSVEGTVEWCTQRDMKTWIASLNFKPLTPENDAILAAFLEDLKHRHPGNRPTE